MEQFEYMTAVLPPIGSGGLMVDELNVLGAEGWEAVGMAPGEQSVPMPGMGATTAPDLVVLLKRQIEPRAAHGVR